jgi:ketosteroid isomerase-like protein
VSQADIETLRAGYEAFTRGDWDSVVASAHADIELKTADRVTSPGTYHGVDELRRFFEDMFEPFEEVVAEPQRFFDRGDRIAVLVRVRARPTGSNAVIENLVGHVWTIRDGKAIRLEIFPQREKALEAIGMPEQEALAESS